MSIFASHQFKLNLPGWTLKQIQSKNPKQTLLKGCVLQETCCFACIGLSQTNIHTDVMQMKDLLPNKSHKIVVKQKTIGRVVSHFTLYQATQCSWIPKMRGRSMSWMTWDGSTTAQRIKLESGHGTMGRLVSSGIHQCFVNRLSSRNWLVISTLSVVFSVSVWWWDSCCMSLCPGKKRNPSVWLGRPG